MSAVLYHKWTIAPEVDISNKTARELDVIWKTAMGLIDTERNDFLHTLCRSGVSEISNYSMVFDILNRTMTRKREYINAESATQYMDWCKTHIPDSCNGFTRVEFHVIDGASLDGEVTGGHVIE